MAFPAKKDKRPVVAQAAPVGQNSLTAARAVLGKVFGKDDDSFVEVDEDKLQASLPHIPTGSVIIDFLIGGKPNKYGVPPCPGFPRGKLINLYGPESCGKTTMCLTVAASTIRRGGKVCYIDWEHAIDLNYSEALGIPVRDETKFLLAQPQTLEKGLSILWAMVKAGVDLVVVDSVGSVVPQAVMDQAIADQGQQGRVGAIAAAWSQFLPKLRALMHRTGSCVVGIAQLRDAVNTGPSYGGGGEKSIQQGGRAWKFQSDVRLSLRKIKTEKTKEYSVLTHSKEEMTSGTVILARMDKCRVAASQGREASFYIKFGEGIDDIRSIIEVATNHGVVTKGGAWLSWERPSNGQELRACGMEAFKALLKEEANVGAWEELYKATLSQAINVTDGVVDEDIEEEDLSDIEAILHGSASKADTGESAE